MIDESASAAVADSARDSTSLLGGRKFLKTWRVSAVQGIRTGMPKGQAFVIRQAPENPVGFHLVMLEPVRQPGLEPDWLDAEFELRDERLEKTFDVGGKEKVTWTLVITDQGILFARGRISEPSGSAGELLPEESPGEWTAVEE